jgi:hypothetical protein
VYPDDDGDGDDDHDEAGEPELAGVSHEFAAEDSQLAGGVLLYRGSGSGDQTAGGLDSPESEYPPYPADEPYPFASAG